MAAIVFTMIFPLTLLNFKGDTMYTRNQLMQDSTGVNFNKDIDQDNHHKFYSQFITPSMVYTVSRQIGIDRIKASKCPHFNDIPLREWDLLAPHIKSALNKRDRVMAGYGIKGDKYVEEHTGSYAFSLSNAVNLAKAAAQIIKEGNQ
jgi:hypothetical protein